MAAPKKSRSSSKEGSANGALVRKYLFVYNFTQLIGWCYVLYSFLSYFTTAKNNQAVNLWQRVFTPVAIIELVSLLEIVHTMIGFVKASVSITSLQILFRIFNTFGVFNLIPAELDTVGVPMTLFAWCGAEITRYSFHIFKEINFVPYFVTWIRYSAFIVLIPIGVGGELLGQYVVQSLYANKWNYSIPRLNITVGYRHLIVLMMLSSAQGILVMYRHMFAQRRKALNANMAHVKSK